MRDLSIGNLFILYGDNDSRSYSFIYSLDFVMQHFSSIIGIVNFQKKKRRVLNLLANLFTRLTVNEIEYVSSTKKQKKWYKLTTQLFHYYFVTKHSILTQTLFIIKWTFCEWCKYFFCTKSSILIYKVQST